MGESCSTSMPHTSEPCSWARPPQTRARPTQDAENEYLSRQQPRVFQAHAQQHAVHGRAGDGERAVRPHLVAAEQHEREEQQALVEQHRVLRVVQRLPQLAQHRAPRLLHGQVAPPHRVGEAVGGRVGVLPVEQERQLGAHEVEHLLLALTERERHAHVVGVGYRQPARVPARRVDARPQAADDSARSLRHLKRGAPGAHVLVAGELDTGEHALGSVVPQLDQLDAARWVHTKPHALQSHERVRLEARLEVLGLREVLVAVRLGGRRGLQTLLSWRWAERAAGSGRLRADRSELLEGVVALAAAARAVLNLFLAGKGHRITGL
eukprot:scaffold18679_cov59-Phaeocystis_antarctica.AAC.8